MVIPIKQCESSNSSDSEKRLENHGRATGGVSQTLGWGWHWLKVVPRKGEKKHTSHVARSNKFRSPSRCNCQGQKWPWCSSSNRSHSWRPRRHNIGTTWTLRKPYLASSNCGCVCFTREPTWIISNLGVKSELISTDIYPCRQGSKNHSVKDDKEYQLVPVRLRGLESLESIGVTTAVVKCPDFRGVLLTNIYHT